ncbi:hypothetical protein J2Z69_002289 [Paenibacillus shirakamiensis]|uniref:Uncharacterized protein n=1 Tax=Paenibacillus shirakamiensis TaxID=1265935 RepID=A0ABS4JHP6_9BACL|nr:hypothetical protein [Paenibacillus shirakamiensis]MBP2001246.1 hypothetical protein [Paenibacillus shirakamiensis]
MLFLLGMMGIGLVIIFRYPIQGLVSNRSGFVVLLQRAPWFQNVWLAGLFIFVVNRVLLPIMVLLLNLTSI